MKTVMSNSMVAHTWAAQKQEHAHSDSMRFNHGVLYSYATPIARIIPGCGVLISTKRYSPTTGKHLNHACRAVSHIAHFSVPALGLTSEGRHSEPSAIWGDPEATLAAAHPVNLAYLRAVYDKTCTQLQRDSYDWSLASISDSLVVVAEEARRYARVFGLDSLVYETTADAERIYAARNTPERLKARAKRAWRIAIENAAQIERDKVRAAARAVENAALIADWRAGAVVYSSYELDCPAGGAMLRLSADRSTVQTSHGVRDIPVDAARTMLGCFLAGGPSAAWLVGQTIGDFQVLEVCDAWVKIGCHIFHRAELIRFGVLLGVCLPDTV